ncbi:hypothetical protein ACQP2P_37800 [Dactylosporangium sp. CA-139114]|uniref:hypothetical protein n=1 Tax=Dactylosporangium sp. CA-139114 TaxID=3239931 RepID=UPI003D95519A
MSLFVPVAGGEVSVVAPRAVPAVEFKPPIEFESGSEYDGRVAVAEIVEAAQPFSAAVYGVQPVAVSGGVADVSGVRPLGAAASERGARLPGLQSAGVRALAVSGVQPAGASEGAVSGARSAGAGAGAVSGVRSAGVGPGALAVSGVQPAGASEGAGAVSGVRSAGVGGRVVAVGGTPATDVAVSEPAFASMAPTVEYAPFAAPSGGSVSVWFVPPGAAWPGFLTAPPGESAGGERED